jgi:hypothetical protein
MAQNSRVERLETALETLRLETAVVADAVRAPRRAYASAMATNGFAICMANQKTARAQLKNGKTKPVHATSMDASIQASVEEVSVVGRETPRVWDPAMGSSGSFVGEVVAVAEVLGAAAALVDDGEALVGGEAFSVWVAVVGALAAGGSFSVRVAVVGALVAGDSFSD